MRILLLILFLSGCGLSPLGFLGSGVNTAANTQIGKTNNQGVNITTAPTTVPQIRPEAPVDTINQTNNNTEIDPLLLLLLILGWLAPSPNEIGRGILRLFKK
jgi:predicted small lipoprotein YifL